MRARSGFSLTEVVVGLGLSGLVMVVVFAFLSGGRRQARQAHAVSGLTERAARLEEALRRDLAGVPAGGAVVAAEDRAGLDLARAARYLPGHEGRLVAGVRRYRFEAGVLSRDGKPLIRSGLTRVAFQLSQVRGRPRLEVELEGEGWPGRPAQTWTLRLPVPVARTEWRGESAAGR